VWLWRGERRRQPTPKRRDRASWSIGGEIAVGASGQRHRPQWGHRKPRASTSVGASASKCIGMWGQRGTSSTSVGHRSIGHRVAWGIGASQPLGASQPRWGHHRVNLGGDIGEASTSGIDWIINLGGGIASIGDHQPRWGHQSGPSTSVGASSDHQPRWGHHQSSPADSFHQPRWGHQSSPADSFRQLAGFRTFSARFFTLLNAWGATDALAFAMNSTRSAGFIAGIM